MSQIDKTTDAEYREDGSKVATVDSPSGETATDHVRRHESELPNGGLTPNDGEDDDSDVAAPSPPTGA